MKLRTLFAMSAVAHILLALGFLLEPATLLKFFGFASGNSEELFGKIMGAALIGFGILAWLGRNVMDLNALQGTLWALLAFNAIGFAVTLLGVMSKVTREGGAWVLVVIFLASAAGYAYFQFAG